VSAIKVPSIRQFLHTLSLSACTLSSFFLQEYKVNMIVLRVKKSINGSKVFLKHILRQKTPNYLSVYYINYEQKIRNY
jgi:hypothetical protein